MNDRCTDRLVWCYAVELAVNYGTNEVTSKYENIMIYHSCNLDNQLIISAIFMKYAKYYLAPTPPMSGFVAFLYLYYIYIYTYTHCRSN